MAEKALKPSTVGTPQSPAPPRLGRCHEHRNEAEAESELLRKHMDALDSKIAPSPALIRDWKPRWGSLMRAGNDKSYSRGSSNGMRTFTPPTSRTFSSDPVQNFRLHAAPSPTIPDHPCGSPAHNEQQQKRP